MTNEHALNHSHTRLLVLIFVGLSLFSLQSEAAIRGHLDFRIIQANLNAIIRLAVAVSYVMGIFFCIQAVMRLKQYGERTAMSSQTGGNLGRMILLFVLGIVLLYLPSATNVLTYSIWANQDPYPFPDQRNLNYSYDVIKTMLLVMRVLGIISFIRGWVMLVRAAKEQGQPGTIGKAAIHIIGGILAFNFLMVFDVIVYSLGFR